MSQGSYSIFVTHPICLIFLVISLVSIFSPLIGPLFKKLIGKKA